MGKQRAEVAIIGAGVIGASIAYNLAKLGCRDVIVLEKGAIGCGSTSKAGGGVRQQFATEVNIRLSLESVEFFKHFEDETGHTADFHQHGYLYVFSTEEDLKQSHRNAALQYQLGGNQVDFLSPEDTKEFIREINIEGVDYWLSGWKRDPNGNPQAPSVKFSLKALPVDEHILDALVFGNRFNALKIFLAIGVHLAELIFIEEAVSAKIVIIILKYNILQSVEFISSGPLVFD